MKRNFPRILKRASCAALAAVLAFSFLCPPVRAEGEEAPDGPKELYQKGLEAMNKENYDEAIGYFNKVLAIKPDIAQLHNIIGIAYMEKKTSLGNAIKEFEEAIRLDPKFSDPYNNLGIVYSGHINDQDLAEEYFKKAVELQPDFSRAYFGLGWLYLIKKQDLKQGAEYLEKAVKYDPSHAEAWYFLGIAYVVLGERPKALGPISQLRRLSRNDLAQTVETMVEQDSSVVKEKVLSSDETMEKPPQKQGGAAPAAAAPASAAPAAKSKAEGKPAGMTAF
jgi:tetratricopeptide (TPR) repeat protein